VPGVGDKTAAKLVMQFGDVDGIYDHLDEVSGKKVPAMLAEHEEQVRTNRRIMRLRRDVELVDLDPADLRLGPVDTPAVRELFGALEFRALYDRFVDEVLGDQEEPPPRASNGPPSGSRPASSRPGSTARGPVAVVAVTHDRPPHVTWEAVAVAAPDRDPAVGPLADLDDADLAALAALLATRPGRRSPTTRRR
jgi:DNA polymerase I